MSQNTAVALTVKSYSRTDFVALRAYVQRVPMAIIADRFYLPDSPQVVAGLERHLTAMRDDLIERASLHNPHIADILRRARAGATMTARALDILVQAADLPRPTPRAPDSLAQWFRPRVALALRHATIQTISDLLQWIERHGKHWSRSIPRIGQLRADAIVTWLRDHAATIGTLKLQELTPGSHAVAHLVFDPMRDQIPIVMDRLILPGQLDGSRGINRHHQFCYIQARNDKDAILTYLSRFIDQPHTYRAYRRELERYLLWAVMVQRKPIASLLVDDCEAYKQFLKSPSPAFVGRKCPRESPAWRPFSPDPLSDRSRKQAVVIIRAFHQYLTDVRYLAGNPWSIVNDPKTISQVDVLNIDRALTKTLWDKIIDWLQCRAIDSTYSQDRIALVLLLLMGDSGLRRHEVAIARRDDLRQSDNVYLLKILGKRSKHRLVPVSMRTINAIRDHWLDRNIHFENYADNPYLLAPIQQLNHRHARKKQEETDNPCYAADALYPVVMSAIRRIANDPDSQFNAPELQALRTCSPHAFRHTFGTLATAAGVPLDVVQKILGHESIATTTIYIRANEKRIKSEIGKLYDQNNSDSIDF